MFGYYAPPIRGYTSTHDSCWFIPVVIQRVTRPDLTFAASQLARFVSNPGEAHYSAAIRVLLYLEPSVGRVLHYRPTVDARLVVYVDSDWGVKFSVSGAFFIFMNCPVAWFARTQRSVSLSSTEAEFFAADPFRES